MQGARVIVKKAPEIEEITCVFESKEYPALFQICPLSSDTMFVLLRNDCEDEFKTPLCVYWAGQDSLIRDSLLNIPDIQSISYAIKEDACYTMISSASQVVYTLDNAAYLRGEKKVIVDTLLLKEVAPYSYFNIQSISKHGNTIVSEEGYQGRVFIRQYSLEGTLLKEYPVYNTLCYNISDFWNTFHVKPDGEKAVMSMEFLDKINYLDLLGKDHYTIITGKRCRDKRKMKNNASVTFSQRPSYYRNAFMTDDRIYVIYYPGVTEAKAKELTSRPIIRVFSWDGEIEAQYRLDRSVFSCIVDESQNLLYGITWENKIVKYSYTKN